MHVLRTFSCKTLDRAPLKAWPKLTAINFIWLRKCVELSSEVPIYRQAIKTIDKSFKLPALASNVLVAKAARFEPKGVPFNNRINYAIVHETLKRLGGIINRLLECCHFEQQDGVTGLNRNLYAHDLNEMLRCLYHLGYFMGKIQSAEYLDTDYEGNYNEALNLLLCFLIVTVLPDLSIYNANLDEVPAFLKLDSANNHQATKIDVFGKLVWREINYKELVSTLLMIHESFMYNTHLVGLLDSKFLSIGHADSNKQIILSKLDFIEQAKHIFHPFNHYLDEKVFFDERRPRHIFI